MKGGFGGYARLLDAAGVGSVGSGRWTVGPRVEHPYYVQHNAHQFGKRRTVFGPKNVLFLIRPLLANILTCRTSILAARHRHAVGTFLGSPIACSPPAFALSLDLSFSNNI